MKAQIPGIELKRGVELMPSHVFVDRLYFPVFVYPSPNYHISRPDFTVSYVYELEIFDCKVSVVVSKGIVCYDDYVSGHYLSRFVGIRPVKVYTGYLSCFLVAYRYPSFAVYENEPPGKIVHQILYYLRCILHKAICPRCISQRALPPHLS